MRKILFFLLMPIFCFAQNSITEKQNQWNLKKAILITIGIMPMENIFSN